MKPTRKNILMGLALSLSLALPAYAATVTLDGTSGSNFVAPGLSTDGDLTLNLGFFAEYLVVAGGGGGGNGGSNNNTRGGGGGGAGGMLTNVSGPLLQVGAESHAVVVGAGGTTGGGTAKGNNGGDSSFAGITAFGGGGGGNHNGTGLAGGSGGGGGSYAAGGLGTAGPPRQGYNGGSTGNTGNNASGGGGAGEAGKSAINSNGSGGGGNGLQNDITGSNVYYAGGGGGRGINVGGLGGGGNTDQAGTDGLGGGGGGGNSGSAKNGGSGVVIVRYAGASVGDGTGGTITAGTGSAAGKTLHTFTSTGSSAFDLSGVDMYARLGVTVTDAITGSGGLTYEGPGRLSLAGTNDYTGATTVSAGTLYVTGALSNSAVSVGANATIGGTGSLGNGLAFAGDSFLEVVDFNDPLAVTGTITFGGGFGIDNLLGIDWDSLTANTPYTVLSTGQSFSTSDIDNFGYDNRVAVGSGRQAYFTNGSLAVIVIPEPGAALLGGLGLLVLLRRRR